MVALNDNERRVLDEIKALPPDRRQVILEMAKGTNLAEAWESNRAYGEVQFRKLAQERGLNWDEMDDGQRQDFIEEICP